MKAYLKVRGPKHTECTIQTPPPLPTVHWAADPMIQGNYSVSCIVWFDQSADADDDARIIYSVFQVAMEMSWFFLLWTSGPTTERIAFSHKAHSEPSQLATHKVTSLQQSVVKRMTN